MGTIVDAIRTRDSIDRGVRRGMARRLAHASAAAVMCVALTVAPSAAKTPAGGEAVGEVDRVAFALPANSTKHSFVVDPTTRLGFRIADHGGGITNLTISSFHLDTLRDVAKVTVDEYAGNPPMLLTAVGGGLLFVADANGWVHAFKQATLERYARFPGALPITGGAVSAAAEYENRHSTERTTPEGKRTPVSAYVTGRMQAMTYVPARPGAGAGKLLLLTHHYLEDPEATANLTVHQWDATTGREEWVYPMSRACGSGRGYAPGVPRWSTGLAVREAGGGHELLLGCIGRGQVGEIWSASYRETTSPNNDVRIAQVFGAGDILFDPDGDRAHVLTLDAFGQSLVAVDLRRRGIVGAVGYSASEGMRTGAGVDPRSGRVYLLAPPSAAAGGRTSSGGLVLVDGRRTPLPQGASFVGEASQTDDLIAIDSLRRDGARRLFVRRVSSAAGVPAPEPFIRVYRDEFAVGTDIPPGAADRFTVDIPEKEGVTAASYAGVATGYGTRAILVGGLHALPDPVAHVRGASTTKDTLPLFTARSACGDTTREVVFASVQRGTTLTNSGMSASAAAAEADPRTIQDMAQPVESCAARLSPVLGGHRVGPDDALGPGAPVTGTDRPWRDTKVPDGDGDAANDDNADSFAGPDFAFAPAVCLLPDRKTDERPHDGDRLYRQLPEARSFRARVSCEPGEEKVIASAEAAPEAIADITFGRSVVTSTLERPKKGGIRATTSAEVRSVTIGDVVAIGRIRNVATAVAGGRPKTAGTQFTAELCGLDMPGLTIADCFDPRSKEGNEIIRTVNTALAARDYEIRVPQPDADLRQGSPKGATAALQKDRFSVQGDRLFNADASTAVPAIELIRTHASGRGRARQIYQFAGVEATTTYNISLVPTAAPISNDPLAVLLPVQGPGGVPGTLITDPGTEGGPGPSLLQRLADAVYAVIKALQWMLRHPLQALSVIAFLLASFALPIHLLDRRRILLGASLGKTA